MEEVTAVGMNGQILLKIAVLFVYHICGKLNMKSKYLLGCGLADTEH
jgi:hypothetical protein